MPLASSGRLMPFLAPLTTAPMTSPGGVVELPWDNTLSVICRTRLRCLPYRRRRRARRRPRSCPYPASCFAPCCRWICVARTDSPLSTAVSRASPHAGRQTDATDGSRIAARASARASMRKRCAAPATAFGTPGDRANRPAMLNRLAGFIHPDRSEALHGGLRWRCDFERLHRHAILT